MPIPKDTESSNPTVRDALAEIASDRGTHVASFVMPDYNVDAENVDYVTSVDHSLNLDDLRAPDALAKEVRFEDGVLVSIGAREHMLKTKIERRRLEDAGRRGVMLIADRSAELRGDIEDVKEYRVAQLATTTANYGATHKVTAQNWRTGDLTSFTATARDVIFDDGGFDITGLVIGVDTLRWIKQNAGMKSFFGDNERESVSLQAIAEYLDVPEVKVARYRRKIGNGTAATNFWPKDFALFMSNRRTLSTRTYGFTMTVPYGAAFGRNGVLTDVRTADIAGVELMMEVGACQRYRETLANANLAYISTAIIGT